MKLRECKMGVLVCVKPDASNSERPLIGHIVGLADPANSGDKNIHNKHELLGKMKADMDRRVWPEVQFCGQRNSTVVDFNDLDLFTAY